MRTFTFLTATFIFFVSIVAPYGFCGEIEKRDIIHLSLKEAVNIAFVQNRDIQMQEREVRAAVSDILGAESEFLPKLNIGGGYTYTEAVITSDLSSIKQGKKAIGALAGYQNDNLLKITLSESFYKGGAHMANFRQAELRLKTQKETLRAKKLDGEFDTKRLYHGLQLAYETERIMQNLVDQAEEHYEDTRRRFQQGTSSRFDVLQSKVHLAKTIPPLVKAQNSVLLIKAELKKLLSINIWNMIKIDKTLECSFIDIDEGEFLDEAYVNKPELVLKELGVDINKWSIKMAQSENLPTIDGSAGYTYRSNNLNTIFDYKHTNWAVGVTFNIPIYDASSAKAKVERARSMYARAIIDKENLIEQTAVDIRKACLDMEEAVAIIISQEDNIVEANEALRLSEVRYDNGVGTNLDVLDAQVSLSQVERNLAEGIYDYLMAKAFLDRTVGLESFKEED
ncbi:MAG: TolC family protein [Candidatus Omnitrophota bacterium]